MKFLVLFACTLAVASAGHLVAPLVYGAQHLPIIGPNGVPVDTAEVQHARAAHLAHKIEAHARNGDLAIAAPFVAAHASPVVSTYAAHAVPIVAAHSAPLVSAYAAHAAPILAHAVPAAYPTTAVLPQSVNGVPLETPEVNAARINHYAAHVEANARNVHAIHYRKRRGIVAPLAYTSPLAYSSPILAAAPLASSYAYSHSAPAYSGAYGYPLSYSHY